MSHAPGGQAPFSLRPYRIRPTREVQLKLNPDVAQQQVSTNILQLILESAAGPLEDLPPNYMDIFLKPRESYEPSPDEVVVVRRGRCDILRNGRYHMRTRSVQVLGLTDVDPVIMGLLKIIAIDPAHLIVIEREVLLDLLTGGRSGDEGFRCLRELQRWELASLRIKLNKRESDLRDYFLPGFAGMVPGPYLAEDVEVIFFLMEEEKPPADLPPGLHGFPQIIPLFRDLPRRYVFAFNRFNKITSRHELGMGKSFSYEEAAILRPCLGPGNLPGAFCPEVYPEHYLAITLGRELYGFPKRFAKVRFWDEAMSRAETPDVPGADYAPGPAGRGPGSSPDGLPAMGPRPPGPPHGGPPPPRDGRGRPPGPPHGGPPPPRDGRGRPPGPPSGRAGEAPEPGPGPRPKRHPRSSKYDLPTPSHTFLPPPPAALERNRSANFLVLDGALVMEARWQGLQALSLKDYGRRVVETVLGEHMGVDLTANLVSGWLDLFFGEGPSKYGFFRQLARKVPLPLPVFIRQRIPLTGPTSHLVYKTDRLNSVFFRVHSLESCRELINPEVIFHPGNLPVGGRCLGGFSVKLSFEFGRPITLRRYDRTAPLDGAALHMWEKLSPGKNHR